MPATPSATSVVPSRHARPKESETMTPISTPASSRMLDRSRAADASGSSGSRTSVSGPFALEPSTPADAHTNPWRVSAMTSGGRARKTSRASPSITSMRRGSDSPASSRARSEGSMPASWTTRPSTFETAFWATTRTSSCSKPVPRAAASTRSAARSSPSSSSGIPRSGITRSSPRQGSPVTWIPAWPL